MPTTQSVLLTVSGTFVVPADVGALWITMSGGGGGGAGATSFPSSNGGGGGGAGEYCHAVLMYVTPGQVIPVTIGAGGAAGGDQADPGGATIFGALRCEGGWPGVNFNNGLLHRGCFTGAGGCGGGIGGDRRQPIPSCAVTGGNNGAWGLAGTSEGYGFYGGSGGGGGSSGASNPGACGGNGGPCQGKFGGPGGCGTPGVSGGGGGGGASTFGTGGQGGYPGSDATRNGQPPPPGSYGAGGGGSTSTAGMIRVGGAGASGAVLVAWIS